MLLKRWSVIGFFSVIGIALVAYLLFRPTVPPGVTPQSGLDDVYKTYAAIAGAITTLGTALFGVLGKLIDYRKARLEIEGMRLDNEKKRRDLGTN